MAIYRRTYSFTIRGNVTVTDQAAEEITYGWLKTALENYLRLTGLPESLQRDIQGIGSLTVDALDL